MTVRWVGVVIRTKLSDHQRCQELFRPRDLY